MLEIKLACLPPLKNVLWGGEIKCVQLALIEMICPVLFLPGGFWDLSMHWRFPLRPWSVYSLWLDSHLGPQCGVFYCWSLFCGVQKRTTEKEELNEMKMETGNASCHTPVKLGLQGSRKFKKQTTNTNQENPGLTMGSSLSWQTGITLLSLALGNQIDKKICGWASG